MPTNAKIRQGNNQESENNIEQHAISTLLKISLSVKLLKKKFNTSLMNLFGCGHLSYKR